MSKYTMTPEEEARFQKNVKEYHIRTGQDPAVHGRLPFRLFDPGPGDPWRELHIIDADNRGVTSIGPLQDPTDMTLGNALFIMTRINGFEDMVKKVADLEEEQAQLQQENKNLMSEIHDLRMKIAEKNVEIKKLRDREDARIMRDLIRDEE